MVVERVIMAGRHMRTGDRRLNAQREGYRESFIFSCTKTHRPTESTSVRAWYACSSLPATRATQRLATQREIPEGVTDAAERGQLQMQAFQDMLKTERFSGRNTATALTWMI